MSKKTYYTYIVYEDASDRFYIGSTSCYGQPEDHNYFGSGKAIKTGEFKPTWKWIYGTYNNRQEAGLAEMELIHQADYKNNPLCMNERCQGANHTDEAAKRISSAKKGKYAGEANPCFGKPRSAKTKKKISESLKGESNPRFDTRLHKFVNTATGETIVGVRGELCYLTGLSYNSVGYLINSYAQSIKGWEYLGVENA